jgi:glutathione S-transferase
MMTPCDRATASSPRRARRLLAEKGLTHETVPIDPMKAGQFGDAFRPFNPQGTVPALCADDGLRLTDKAGITADLAAHRGVEGCQQGSWAGSHTTRPAGWAVSPGAAHSMPTLASILKNCSARRFSSLRLSLRASSVASKSI